MKLRTLIFGASWVSSTSYHSALFTFGMFVHGKRVIFNKFRGMISQCIYLRLKSVPTSLSDHILYSEQLFRVVNQIIHLIALCFGVGVDNLQIVFMCDNGWNHCPAAYGDSKNASIR